jgi:DNA polymerase-4
MTPNGCVIASSIEAKAKGIKTGVRIQDARRLDPRIIFIANDAAKYRSCTEGITRILHRYTEAIEHYSIDEAFLDLTGFVQTMDEANRMMERIRAEIQDEVGIWLRCSIGLAHTRWLAKFAGDTAPKGGTLILTPETLPAHIASMPLTEAWGIASAIERRLNALGIFTLDELRRYPVANLMQSLGVRGYELWANLNGIEFSRVQYDRLPKSIGHSHVFTHKAQDMAYPKAILAKLCEKAGRRLRRLGLEAGGVWVSYGIPDWVHERYGVHGGGGVELFSEPITDTRDIFSSCWNIVQSKIPPGIYPNYLAMTLIHLRPVSRQLAFWSKDKQDDRALAAALDTVNNQFGDFTVTRGSFWGMTDRDAPDRIGFRKTVALDIRSGKMEWT